MKKKNVVLIVLCITIIVFIAMQDRIKYYENFATNGKIVTVYLNGGFGNQMFQTACMMGYAEKYGYTPMFLEEPKNAANHPNSQLSIRTFFPNIQVISNTTNITWKEYHESEKDCYIYNNIPNYDKNIKLVGYFQTAKYFPTDFHIPMLTKVHKHLNLNNRFFMHIRRGDYMLSQNAAHLIDFSRYHERCLREFDPSYTCFVISDDVAWCKDNLPDKYAFWKNWEFIDANVNDADTLYYMTQCERGGICANSSFSWWAAYFLHENYASAKIFMPSVWHKKLEAMDVVPEWANKVDI